MKTHSVFYLQKICLNYLPDLLTQLINSPINLICLQNISGLPLETGWLERSDIFRFNLTRSRFYWDLPPKTIKYAVKLERNEFKSLFLCWTKLFDTKVRDFIFSLYSIYFQKFMKIFWSLRFHLFYNLIKTKQNIQ